ncbi:hypothetical protein QR680_009166 [Steinernema hermaphroditum]|uniref:CCHC-type domain-containing protein n=1 Tax=Steinernema hermaphroditum TaxID=289476 RepID=A0AA39M9E3_9BILA|nr:hypothetical protein QR680_009166 [Steinernema hermaphroditum]
MSEHDEAASTLEEKVDSMQAIQSQLLETQSQMAVLMKRLSDQMASSQQPAAISEKPLRSSGLDRQYKLNSDWIKRLEQMSSSIEDNTAVTALLEDMKARNVMLRKGDACPSFFPYVDDRLQANPDKPLAQVVSEALEKFIDLEAARANPVLTAASFKNPLGRKRNYPFRQGGGSGSRASVTWNSRDNSYASLSAQVQLLQQQVSAGFGNLNAVSPYPRGPNQPMCFQCKGFGHYSNKCPQGPSRQ